MPERARYRQRRAANLCVACGQHEPRPGRTRCEACSDAAILRAAELRAYTLKHGLCEACLRRKRKRGRGNRCTACADKYLAAQLLRERKRRELVRARSLAR
jgi:hypothetical protein